jgi:hypothetical protein
LGEFHDFGQASPIELLDRWHVLVWHDHHMSIGVGIAIEQDVAVFAAMDDKILVLLF